MTTETNAPALVSEERLREILDGCEGVTPGPWAYRPWAYDDEAKAALDRTLAQGRKP